MMGYRIVSPDGGDGSKSSQIRFMNSWVKQLQEEGQDIVNATIGSPTYPTNEALIDSQISYWQSIKEKASNIRNAILGGDPDATGGTIGYGDTQGEFHLREQEAAALQARHPALPDYYGPENILTTSGGGSQLGLNAVFHATEKWCPGGVIIAAGPPIYPNYDNMSKMHRDGAIETNSEHQESKLWLADIMNQPGYTLTGKSLEDAILNAEAAGKPISAIILNDPHIPLGTVIGENWHDIVEVLKNTPDVPIILDEAHFQMTYPPDSIEGKLTFQDLHLSLLDVAAEKAPELLDRIILLRSATKGLGASGERMGMIAAPEPYIEDMKAFMGVMVANSPISAQVALAAAHASLTPEEQAEIGAHHGRRVLHMFDRLKTMGAFPADDGPGQDYKPAASFCNFACVKDLYGLPVTDEMRRALPDAGETISNDLEAAIYLLMEHQIGTVQGSAFGMSPDDGWLRIVCSQDLPTLDKAADRIEAALEHARTVHQTPDISDLSSNHTRNTAPFIH